jgi:hypothetical protein
MKMHGMTRVVAAATLAALGLTLETAAAQEKGGLMSHRASGTFDVKVEPIPAESKGDRPSFPRLTLDKQFHGGLEGTSQGEMMSVNGTVEGSAGAVAIELFSGSLLGRKGSFALVHSATMRRGGEFNMIIRVVPDSGTEQLAGLTGTLEIIIEGKAHRYNFDYSISESP